MKHLAASDVTEDRRPDESAFALDERNCAMTHEHVVVEILDSHPGRRKTISQHKTNATNVTTHQNPLSNTSHSLFKPFCKMDLQYLWALGHLVTFTSAG
jgi:hypothetical protein